MADVKWIKIRTDIFDDEKILLIESMPEKDSIIVIWFKLLCLAGKQNNSGVFMMNDRIAYTDEMLATVFRRPINTVRMALQAFEAYGMVEIIDSVITIPNWEKHQSIDKMEKIKEQNRLRVARHRERQRLLTTGDGCNITVTESNAVDKIRLEEDKNKKDKPTRHKHGEYQNVLLSDQDMEKLRAEFPNDWEERIERLSSYMASTGKSYKNHLATIRNWARRDRQKAHDSKPKQDEYRPARSVEEIMEYHGISRENAQMAFDTKNKVFGYVKER